MVDNAERLYCKTGGVYAAFFVWAMIFGLGIRRDRQTRDWQDRHLLPVAILIWLNRQVQTAAGQHFRRDYGFVAFGSGGDKREGSA